MKLPKDIKIGEAKSGIGFCCFQQEESSKPLFRAAIRTEFRFGEIDICRPGMRVFFAAAQAAGSDSCVPSEVTLTGDHNPFQNHRPRNGRAGAPAFSGRETTTISRLYARRGAA